MGGSPAVSFADVLREELRQIERSRRERGQSHRLVEPDGTPEQRACHSQLLGLAFSGGGIRSATFNLGVLQGMADLGLLSKFDYLSTVSGGGYIGTWLAVWIYRTSLSRVIRGLRTDRDRPRGGEEPHEIHFLRQYSNYLTPRLGLLGADTWALISTYLRNLLLNQTILILAVAGVLLLPRGLAWLSDWFAQRPWLPGWLRLAVAVALLFLAISWIGRNLRTLDSQANQGFRWWHCPGAVQWLVVVPVFLAAWIASRWLSSVSRGTPLWLWAVFAAGAYCFLWLSGRILASETDAAPQAPAPGRSGHTWAYVFFTPVAGALGGVLLWCVLGLFERWSDPSARLWHVVVLGPPLMVGVFSLVVILHIGLMKWGFSDHVREWWARLGGWLLIYSVVWLTVFGIAVYGPLLVMWVGVWGQASLGIGWVVSTVGGILGGKSPATGKPSGNPRLELALKVAPYVFVVGLLLLLSLGIHLALPYLLGAPGASQTVGDYLAADSQLKPLAKFVLRHAHWGLLAETLTGWLWVLVLGCFVISLVLSCRVDINQFSMHLLYQNRLVRCYLGATRGGQRRPNPFTGFDREDGNILLQNLVSEITAGNPRPYQGPYPIVNCALNLVQGDELAWQTRKATSFIFTPCYSGYEVVPSPTGTDTCQWARQLAENGYCPTGRYGYAHGGVYLPTAMTISGAAVSPNSGYHSAPALAFLMTLFDVRLGWWIGNPRHPRTWSRSTPRLGLFYLLFELLGMSNDRRGYVYLSDGGHFENLAIYELVRRCCGFIVVCDAEEDHEMKFGGLGNAIEKCRTDFGVDIELNVAQLRPAPESGLSQWHCAVGTIRYDKVNSAFPTGTLIYLKASLTGDEPTDVQRYKSQHPDFPHQSTADQWFDEPQFESYRALGHHVVRSVFEAVGAREELARMPVESLFVQLRQRWYTPSAAVGKAFTRHTATYSHLLERMASDPNLRFLDLQVYPEWSKLVEGSAHVLASHELWLPSSYEERRAGFYFCNQLIQLMEDAYIDLNLEEEYDHPDNRGWMNLFRHWVWSGMFVATWSVSASTYGARFQRFCERHLDLRSGTVEIDCQDRSLLLRDDAVERYMVLRRLGQSQRLNFWEVELTRAFLEWGHRPENQPPGFALQIVPFEMVVPSPLRDGRELRFVFGFALVRIVDSNPQKTEIWYFRIQNHLRRMGLARAALNALMRRYACQVENRVEEAPEHLAKEFDRLAGQTSLREAVPTAEAVQTFRRIFESVKLSC